MARVVLIALLLALAGCASAPEPFTPGIQMPPPAGWVDYCTRNTNDIDCEINAVSPSGKHIKVVPR